MKDEVKGTPGAARRSRDRIVLVVVLVLVLESLKD
jgi:hypothetical protein